AGAARLPDPIARGSPRLLRRPDHPAITGPGRPGTSPSAILPRPYQVAHDRARPRLGISHPLLGDRRLTPGDDADRSLRGVLGGQDTRDPAPVPDRRLPS